MAPEALLFFVRYPVAGEAKTRLIPRLGPEGAAKVYRLIAEEVAGEVRRFPRPDLIRVAFVEPPERLEEARGWLGKGFEFEPQARGDLGERLTDAFNWAFGKGAGRVVVIGTDCLDLRGNLLQEAFEALMQNDAVLGPALDGGYYLIGLSRPLPEVFEGIPWSTEKVSRAALERLGRCKATCKLLPPLRDLDTPEDLDALLPRWGEVLGNF